MNEFLGKFRQQYPLYANVPDEALADNVYETYYKGAMDRADFHKAIGLPERGGLLDDIGRSVARGASFGFADEIAAAGDATVGGLFGLYDDVPEDGKSSWGARYDTSLKTQRSKDHQFDRERPVTSTVAKIGGGVAGAVATLPQAAMSMPTTFAGAIQQGAAVGAGTGALAGFGEGEGGLGNRATGAVEGATVGAAVGGALPIAAVPVVKSYELVRNVLGLQNPQKMALQKTAQAFQRDNVRLGDAADEAGRLGAAGKPAAAFDVGGENVLGLARAAAGTPGPAKNKAVEMLAARQGTMETAPQVGQVARVVKDAEGALGQKAGQFGQTFDDLLTQARNQARPLYEKLYSHNGGVVVSDKLDDLASNPIIREAMKKGTRIAQAEGDDLAGLGITGFNEAGEPVIGKALTIKGFDYAKRGLDDLIEASKRSGENETTRALMTLKNRLTGEIDSLTGGLYGQARSAYAGPMAMRDAMELGKNILKEDGGYQIAKEIAKLGPSEKQAFLEGVMENIRVTAMNAPDGADVVKRIFGKPILREKLKAAFPDERSFMMFQKNMLDEAMLYRNAQSVSPKAGSQTELRMAEKQDMAGSMLGDAAESLVTGRNATSVLFDLARAGKQRAQGMNAKTASSLTDMLFNPNSAATQKMLRDLDSMGPVPLRILVTPGRAASGATPLIESQRR